MKQPHESGVFYFWKRVQKLAFLNEILKIKNTCKVASFYGFTFSGSL